MKRKVGLLNQPQPLTPKQRKVLEVIQRLTQEGDGVLPSRRELALKLGISSVATVQQHIEVLERKGWLQRGEPGGVRDMKIISTPPRGLFESRFLEDGVRLLRAEKINHVPVIGRIAAGSPIHVPSSGEDYRRAIEEGPSLEIPSDFLQAKSPIFALIVQGDSMQDEGLLDGDWVFIERCETARSGDIVAAMLNGEMTLKRYQKPGKGPSKDEHTSGRNGVESRVEAWLLPANKKYHPIPVHAGDDFQIQGVLVGMMRKYSKV